MSGQGARRGPHAARRRGRRRNGALRALAAALSIAAVTGVSRADTLDEARHAFERGQFVRAAEIWRGLARAGEPEAAFRLGLMHDLGLGPAPDAGKAFSRYLEAAHRGHATAQFNVGVMLDAGTGPLSSAAAAASWYARAAAKGFARAEYNLALLYAEGDGLPRNTGLARAWMARASATLPAAAERLGALRTLDPGRVDAPAVPEPVAAATVRASGDGPTLELVWTAVEQPPGTRYHIEFEGVDGDLGTGTAEDGTDVSAIAIPLPPSEPRRWRVLATLGERSAASDWQPLFDGGDEPPADEKIATRSSRDPVP